MLATLKTTASNCTIITKLLDRTTKPSRPNCRYYPETFLRNSVIATGLRVWTENLPNTKHES